MTVIHLQTELDEESNARKLFHLSSLYVKALDQKSHCDTHIRARIRLRQNQAAVIAMKIPWCILI